MQKNLEKNIYIYTKSLYCTPETNTIPQINSTSVNKSPVLQADSLPSEPPGKPNKYHKNTKRNRLSNDADDKIC